MSAETPRTDAQASIHDEYDPSVSRSSGYNDLLDHARRLDRELADLKKTNAMLADNWANTERLLAHAAAKADAEMERVKACEHIADGDEGWEVLRNLCPSTAAVAGLRDRLAEGCEITNDLRKQAGEG